MGTCKTCRWWKLDDNGRMSPDYPAELAGRIGECNSMSGHRRFQEDRPDEWSDGRRAIAMALMEGIGAEVFTRDDFGCVHHEERSKES